MTDLKEITDIFSSAIDLEDECNDDDLIRQLSGLLSPSSELLTTRSEKSKKEIKDEVKALKMKLFLKLGKDLFWKNQQKFIDTVNNNFPETRENRQYCQLIEFRAHIYAVKMSGISFTNPKSGNLWVCVKVGMTQAENPGARPAAVKSQIKSNFKKEGYIVPECDVEILFCVPVSFTNSNRVEDIESKVRKTVGIPISSDDAKMLKLPVPTEWVCAPQNHIDSNIMNKLRLNPDADTYVLTKNVSEYNAVYPTNMQLRSVYEKLSEDEGTHSGVLSTSLQEKVTPMKGKSVSDERNTMISPLTPSTAPMSGVKKVSSSAKKTKAPPINNI